MADTLKRLWGPALLTNSSTLQYSVPGSAEVLISCIHIGNVTTADHTFRLSIGTDANGTRLFTDVVVPANGVFLYQAPIHLAVGETIYAQADANTALNISATGVEST